MADDPIRYKLLNAFRGMAILWIVCFHLLCSACENYGFIINAVIKHGYLGVSVFFVLSGYGIAASTSIATGYHHPHRFLMRRLKKIYFCYWWSLLITALIIPFFHAIALIFKTHAFIFLPPPYSLMEWFQVITLIKVFSATSWALHISFDPLNGPIWFLAVIVQIYIYVFICLYFNKHYALLMFLGFIAAMLTYVPAIKDILPYGIFVPYFAQFYVGFAVYALIRRNYVPQKKLTMLLIFITSLGIFYFCASKDNQFLPLCFALTVGYVFLITYKYDCKLEHFLVARIFYIIGLFSYSLYLLHFPLRIWGGMFAKNIFPFLGDSTKPLVNVAVVITLSFIWYLFFEKPSSQINILKCLSSPIHTLASGLNLIKRIAYQK